MSRINVIWLVVFVFGIMSCKDQGDSPSGKIDNQAHDIVSKAIEAMGGHQLDHAKVTFDFRDQSLSYYNKNGQFRYTRTFPDTAGHIIKDTLTNDDFIRYKDGQKLDLTSEEKEALKGGVNSIIYFAFLPYRLQDAAVIKEYIDQVNIKGKPYEKIKVSFEQEGGGTDHEDVYYYYFDPEDYSLDYLAYDFHVNDGGIRFRSSYNERTVDGLTVRDYINYMANPDSVDYSRIEQYYDDDELKELSRVELKNVKVEPLK